MDVHSIKKIVNKVTDEYHLKSFSAWANGLAHFF